MRIDVRELQRGDGSIWKGLRLRALVESPEAFAVTYESDAQRPDESWHSMIDATADDPLSTSVVAEVDGKPVGMAYCRLDTTDRSLGQLFAMWVDPSHRGQGVGRALLVFAMRWMRERGATVSELAVTETNRAAIRLYESAGYADTGERETLREGSALKVIKMRREIEDLRTT